MLMKMKPLWIWTGRWGAILLLIVATRMERSLLGTPKEKDKQPQPFALLVGTCFDENGFSLPGAEVIIQLMPSESGTKKWERFSSPRGEFAVRLPAGASAQPVRPARRRASFPFHRSDISAATALSRTPSPADIGPCRRQVFDHSCEASRAGSSYRSTP